MASEDSALSSSILEILRAPTWISPIAKFVDDNCSTFEDVEENLLEHTLIHNRFRQLVDELLVAHLMNISVSAEQFVRFCSHGLSGTNQINRAIVEQLLSVEDFLVFKAMMVKRNAEITREVVGAESALAISGSSAQGDFVRSDESTADGVTTAAQEAERLEAERRCVEAELQLAEALSLQLEKRLQLMEALDEVLDLVAKIYKLQADAVEAKLAETTAGGGDLGAPPAEVAPPALSAPLTLGPIQRTSRPTGPALPPTVCVRPLDPMSAPADTSRGAVDVAALSQKRAEAAAQRERTEAAPSGPSEEERRARADHLKRQREALIEKKNQERALELTAFQSQHGETAASQAAERACAQGPDSPNEAGRRLAAELSGQAAAEACVDSEAAARANQAIEMRRVLSRQLKQTLMQAPGDM